MGLADVHLTTRTNLNILAASVVLVVVGGVASTVPVYGWLLSVVFGIAALFLSQHLQRTELSKAFRLVLEDSQRIRAKRWSWSTKKVLPLGSTVDPATPCRILLVS